jgi:hypothetical protein
MDFSGCRTKAAPTTTAPESTTTICPVMVGIFTNIQTTSATSSGVTILPRRVYRFANSSSPTPKRQSPIFVFATPEATAFILGASSTANACVRFITAALAALYMERSTKSLMPAIETTLITDPSFITLAVSREQQITDLNVASSYFSISLSSAARKRE